jgi:hypothetical protein
MDVPNHLPHPAVYRATQQLGSHLREARVDGKVKVKVKVKVKNHSLAETRRRGEERKDYGAEINLAPFFRGAWAPPAWNSHLGAEIAALSAKNTAFLSGFLNLS